MTISRAKACLLISALGAAAVACGPTQPAAPEGGEKPAATKAEGGAAPAQPVDPAAATRTIEFPADRALGMIQVRDRGSDQVTAWKDFDKATGSIRVPVSLETMLKVDADKAADLSALKTLKPDDLQEISFEGVKVENAQLANLAHLTGLVGLNLNKTGIDDAGLEQIKGLVNLKKLSLGTTNITDAGLSNLSGMASLERLWLQETQITGVGLANLSPLRSLQRLILAATKIDDAALVHLAGLPSLARLGINNNAITDAAVEPLSQLKGLAELNVAMTKMSPDGINKLKEKSPQLNVSTQ